MTGPVYDEFPNRVRKMWKDAEKEERRKAGIDVDMEDEGDGNKGHRDMFARNPMKNAFYNGYGSESGSDSDEDDSDESSDDGKDMEFNVMVSQNYF